MTQPQIDSPTGAPPSPTLPTGVDGDLDLGPVGLTICPECGETAEVLDRFDLSSTSGQVEHVRISCLAARHHFTMPLL